MKRCRDLLWAKESLRAAIHHHSAKATMRTRIIELAMGLVSAPRIIHVIVESVAGRSVSQREHKKPLPLQNLTG